MNRLLRWLLRRKPEPAGEPICWCRALRNGRCQYNGRFCNPQKQKDIPAAYREYPCPIALEYQKEV